MVTITEYNCNEDELTGFLNGVWPRLEAQAGLITNTYLLRYPGSMAYLYDKLLVDSPHFIQARPANGVLDLGPLCSLERHALESVKYGSFYNGHLNVLFLLKEEVLNGLLVLSCFKEKHELKWDDFGALGAGERIFLESVLRCIPKDSAALTFAHDGEPLYLFSWGRKWYDPG